ncbi:LON peptidase substrate-binding domain-containing protein [Compostibacter hankyongensis]|uniref:Lon N-terminal domain-containing protein n=1 Tax=Compostibacter hankyongensis TaxID=1007089 RepID=A0ABP8FDZ7_9BACT
MTNFIPIFPLEIVVYPTEHLNLHIFEPRYKQLIAECFAQQKPFGIPSVIGGTMKEFGTLVEILSIEKRYENGEMDIRTRGLKVFRVLETIRDVPDKLYSGAIVHYPRNIRQGNDELMQKILRSIRELHALLKVSRDFSTPEAELSSYDVAHHAGLQPEEEYEMLCLMQERQRQEYLRRHLGKAIPLLAEMENLKQRIQLNGHFRNLPGYPSDPASQAEQ